MSQTNNFRFHIAIAALLATASPLIPATGTAQTIIDEWSGIKAPSVPELKPVKIDPRTTALLVLDMVKPGCNNERRPRCVISIPAVQNFLGEARRHGVAVIHSQTLATKPGDVLPEFTPQQGEPVVASVSDKFFRTELENILKQKEAKTVIVVGTAAHGAVLYTASGAAFRGMQVVLPVDGISADSAYIEQYVAWHLSNAPGVGQRVTLTRFGMMAF